MATKGLEIDFFGEARLVVEDRHLATTLGSGREAVFATPAMIALIEAAAVACVEDRLPPGQASLGIRICVEHVAPTPLGHPVTATARLSEIKGRRLFFVVQACDDRRVIGRGEHIRVIVDREEFRARLEGGGGG